MKTNLSDFGLLLKVNSGPCCPSMSGALSFWMRQGMLPVGAYVIVYCVEDEDALILRVVHGRRDLEALFGF